MGDIRFTLNLTLAFCESLPACTTAALLSLLIAQRFSTTTHWHVSSNRGAILCLSLPLPPPCSRPLLGQRSQRPWSPGENSPGRVCLRQSLQAASIIQAQSAITPSALLWMLKWRLGHRRATVNGLTVSAVWRRLSWFHRSLPGHLSLHLTRCPLAKRASSKR